MTNAAALTFDRQTRLYLYLIIALGLCLRLVYFSEDIGGSHTFRQAMVANQIDSLKSKPYPGPKLGFLERYDQTYDYGLVFYDTPIYQYIAAKISDIFNIAGVRAGRLVNLAVYIGMSLAWYEIMIGIGLGSIASLLSVSLFALSPLAIQTTFGIYPDTIATLAAYLSFHLLLRYEREGLWRHLGIALATLVGALNLSEIVISGRMDLLDDRFRAAVVDTIRNRTFPTVGQHVTARFSSLGDDGVLLGAAALVLRNELGIV